jgi:hypothetical protein
MSGVTTWIDTVAGNRIRRRTRVVGAFPDGQSALNLAAAKLRHIAGTAWLTKRYLNIELPKDQQMRDAITREPVPGAAQLCERAWTLPSAAEKHPGETQRLEWVKLHPNFVYALNW